MVHLADLHQKCVKYVISNMFHVCINTVIQLTIRRRTNKAIQMFCLKRKSYAAIGGKRRRNIFTFQEIQWCVQYNTYSLLFTIFLLMLVHIKLIESPRTLMILWCCMLVVGYCFKSVFLHWKILLKDYDYQSVWREPFKMKYTPFYVRKPDMIPRN